MTLTRYSDHLDTLIVLATYLALTPKISRTSQGLATDLSLREHDVQTTLDGFPGVFRKSENRSAEGEWYYTLHARYALRKADAEGQNLAELRSDLLSTLLQFVSHQAAQESSFDQFSGAAGAQPSSYLDGSRGRRLGSATGCHRRVLRAVTIRRSGTPIPQTASLRPGRSSLLGS